MKWRDNPDASVRNEEAVAYLLVELRQLITHWRYMTEHAVIVPDLSSAADDLEEVLGAAE